jgi:hypothetical protein
MLLEDNHSDLRIKNLAGQAFEIWWLYPDSKELVIVSHCPLNFPTTAVHTMPTNDGIVELKKLVREGWKIEHATDEFRKLCGDSWKQIKRRSGRNL